MDEQATRGISDTRGFQSITQEADKVGTTFSTQEDSVMPDRLGIRYWPKLFQYLEEHFSFSASILSITGYVIIAAFGSMQTLGQYLGYILFLGGILFVYNFNKKNIRWLYFFMIATFLLIGILLFQNWSYIHQKYRSINKPFGIGVNEQIAPEQAQATP